MLDDSGETIDALGPARLFEMLRLKTLLRRVLFRMRGDHTTEQLVSLGLRVGKDFLRLHGVILDPAHCWLITIGDGVTLAPRVHVLAHDASTKRALGYTRIGRVDIGDRVFIGAESVILPNVRIGDDVIIGANSTVTRDVPSGTVYAGTPARFVCRTDELLSKTREKMRTRPVFSEEYTLRRPMTDLQKEEMRTALASGVGFVV